MTPLLFLIFLLLSSRPPALVTAKSNQPLFEHNQQRVLTCFEHEGADCRLLSGSSTLLDADTSMPTKCTERTNPEGDDDETVVHCELQCQGATAAYVVRKLPSHNHRCLAFFSYGIQAPRTKDGDWTLWRKGGCLMQEIQFQIGCTFPFKFGSLNGKKANQTNTEFAAA